MKTTLNWEKGAFSSTYNIFSGDSLIGKLKDKIFSREAEGEINGRKITFVTSGFFKPKTRILEGNEVLGEIKYNNWMTKAVLSITERKANWKYDSLWQTKWSITNSSNGTIKYTNSAFATKGTIESNVEDDLLLLSGLFIGNYYLQMGAVVILIIFIPTIFN